ncbi:hypothetical protein ADMFC3_02620 [Geovibrio sp. ADMFC3]
MIYDLQIIFNNIGAINEAGGKGKLKSSPRLVRRELFIPWKFVSVKQETA